MAADEPIEEDLQDVTEDADDGAGEAPYILPLATDLDTAIPAIRDIRPQFVRVGEKRHADAEPETVVLLEDPEGLVGQPVALSTFAFALAGLFNGRRNAREVVAAFEQKFEQSVDPMQVLELQRELDRALLLYSSRFERAVKRQIQSFLTKETRSATHAGSAYPADPLALHETVNSFFISPEGPGALPASKETASISKNTLPPIAAPQSNTVKALILPHIDLRVGGPTYAHGYARLLRQSQAELFFVLGVAHQPSSDGGLYMVSQKDYETPLGLVKTEKSIANRLQLAAGTEPAMAELAHRTEHSIEFQAVLLASLLQRQKRDFEIVPILCGSVDSFLGIGANPLEGGAFREFAQALRNEIDICNRRWCVICSVDFSHVGPEFDHSTSMTERLLPAVERYDRRLLMHAANLDVSAFFKEIDRTHNSRHVDAVVSVLTMLKACEGLISTGKLLHYDQLFKEGTHSAVSYASLSFE